MGSSARPNSARARSWTSWRTHVQRFRWSTARFGWRFNRIAFGVVARRGDSSKMCLSNVLSSALPGSRFSSERTRSTRSTPSAARATISIGASIPL